MRSRRAPQRRAAARRGGRAEACASASNWSCRPSTARPPATRSGSPRASSGEARGARETPASAISAGVSASACSASRPAVWASSSARERRCPVATRDGRSRLVGEHRRRRGDPAPGGGSRAPIMTAYRQQALRCAQALADGVRRPRDRPRDRPRRGEDPAAQRLRMVRAGRARPLRLDRRRASRPCSAGRKVRTTLSSSKATAAGSPHLDDPGERRRPSSCWCSNRLGLIAASSSPQGRRA